MAIYFAKIEETYSHGQVYYNLCPIFQLNDKDKELIEIGDIKDKFPNAGIITITGQHGGFYSGITNDEFGFYEIDIHELYKSKNPDDVEKGKRYNCYRIYETKLKQKRIDLDQYPIYETFDIPPFFSIEKLKELQEIKLSGYNLKPVSKFIYLRDVNKNKVYGPFEWSIKDEQSIRISSCEKNNYFVNSYSFEDLEDVYYRFDAVIISDNHPNYGLERAVIFCDKFDYEYEKIDFINMKVLTDEMAKAIQLTDSSYNLNELKKIMRGITSLKLNEGRKQKILTMFENSEAVQGLSTEVASCAVNNSDNMEKIINEILSNPEFKEKVMNQLKGTEKVFSELKDTEDRKRTELEELEREIQALKEEKQELGSKVTIDNAYDELEWLEEEKKKLLDEVGEIRIELNLSQEIEDLRKRTEEAKREHYELTKIIHRVEDDIKRKVENAYVDVAFNGTIANEVLKAAAGFEKQSQLNKYKEMVAYKEKVPEVKDSFSDEEKIIEYLHMLINNKGKRKMSRNEIVNILLCIMQGFLTVFAGEPGTGKTSLCALISNVLGLNRVDKYNRYIEVSVERGWTSKRDFIGYYNPLTKLFDKANGQLFDAFNILNIEAQEKVNDFPYFILLDEANLSPMEHYWADFMNVCDMSKSCRQINLSEDYQLSVPKNLRFLATINYDHTTEVFSPRLLDRAWVILLQSKQVDINSLISVPEMEVQPIITYEELNRVFGVKQGQSLDDSIAEKFNEINNFLRENQLHLSPRVIIMIKNYCIAGEKLFDKSKNRYVALDYAMSQKVMPMINGFGDGYKEFLESLKAICDKADMPMCNKILEDIIRKGDNNMQYYQFFAK